MNESTNRRRILAGVCFTLLGLQLGAAAVRGLLADATAPTASNISRSGFGALVHAGLTVAAICAITHLLRRRADRIGLFGAALAVLGTVVGARIGVLIQLSLAGATKAGSPRETMTALLQQTPEIWASIIPVGLMYPLGLMTLGLALFFVRPVPRAIGLLLAAGAIFFPLGRALDLFVFIPVSDLLLGLGYALLAWTVLTKREVWDAASVPAT